MRDLRLIFCGDSLINGTCDEGMLGWAGRLACLTAADTPRVTHYNLGVRHETTLDLHARLKSELDARLKGDFEKRIIISIGHNDVMFEDGTRRVPEDRTLPTMRSIIQDAMRRGQTLIVSPPASNDPSHTERIFHISEQMKDLCDTTGVPFVPAHEFTAKSQIWMDGVAQNDGRHPQAMAYAELASWIFHLPQWKAFIAPAP